MTTKFQVFRGPVSSCEELINRANEALVEIEAEGGKYIDSHWSTAGPTGGGGLNATLVVVYEEPKERKLGTARSF